jgi:hypothetical protein
MFSSITFSTGISAIQKDTHAPDVLGATGERAAAILFNEKIIYKRLFRIPKCLDNVYS